MEGEHAIAGFSSWSQNALKLRINVSTSYMDQ